MQNVLDYFQMSEELGRRACRELDEFLHLPTVADIKSIVKLHKLQHNFDGMSGSLDCTHTNWKNCLKAWHGSFKGKENNPSIVLEALCDYHPCFWHASYGYAGTLHDHNILNLSPFRYNLTNGKFKNIKKESNVIPFVVAKDNFHSLYILIDGVGSLLSSTCSSLVQSKSKSIIDLSESNFY